MQVTSLQIPWNSLLLLLNLLDSYKSQTTFFIQTVLKMAGDHHTVIDMPKAAAFTGGLGFSDLTYAVAKKQKIDGKWVTEEVDLLHRITGYAPKGCVTAVMGPSGAGKSTFLDALDCQREPERQVVKKHVYWRRRNTRSIWKESVGRSQIWRGIIHALALLFLDEPTSGLDSTSAHSVIERVHDIARSGSTVILTIHQPSYRIQMLLDHMVILARGQLMFIGSPRDVGGHLGRMGRKVPKGENSIEHLLDVIQEYDQSEQGVSPLADFCLTGLKPPRVNNEDRPSPGHYTYANEILSSTPTPHSSDYTVSEHDYLTPNTLNGTGTNNRNNLTHGPKFANSYLTEIWILMRRNFTNIRRTPELFLSRQMVLTVMGVMMATMFLNPKDDPQGITDRLSFIIFTCCLFFFSSNDAVPAFIQERFIFIRETSHNAYRASSYTVSGLITYLPFLLVQAATYAVIVWFALKLHGQFYYFLIVLYVSLLSTNSFVVFVSSVVPNFILGYAAVIAFTALFFLFCGYFISGDSIPQGWKWMNYISTMKYPYEGLLMNELVRDRVFAVSPLGPVTGEDILKQLSISTKENEKWMMVLYLSGWAVFYRALFYLVLRFASKNQRT
ncbi:uncharacterized protein A4U43_C07F20600 [Asparagus officinalis]|uniref:ABC transporter domain-containing protein n=1 Tax=Asparagus officinalis TaxID=4686 RepID=A0A5P1EDM5_ASPOF|nr:uncharacterized protein A4U43_C07F20600 [Asparagus officinalis]